MGGSEPSTADSDSCRVPSHRPDSEVNRMTTTPGGTRETGGIPGPRKEIPAPGGVETPSENVPARRVIARMRHGGHAIVDAAPEAKEAVDAGAVLLSDVTQDAEVAQAGEV